MTTLHFQAGFVPSLTEGIARNVQSLTNALAAEGVPVRLATTVASLRELNRPLGHARNAWRGRAALARELDNPEVRLAHVHVNIASMGVYARAARRQRPSTPLVLHVWNALWRGHEGNGRAPLAARALQRATNGRWAASLGWGAADALVVSSRYQETQLRDAGYDGPLQVVPNGVDTRTYHPASPRERDGARAKLGLAGDPVLVYYGHLSPWKGVEVFLRALPSVLRSRPDAEVVLSHTDYGRGEAWLRERLRTLGLSGRVTVLGPTHVPTLLAAADLAVLPALAGVGTACYPNCLLECLAAGVPVVASAVGAVPELVDDGRNGWLVPPGEATALAHALDRAAGDASARRAAGAAARATAEPLSWSTSARRMREMYAELGVATARVPVAAAADAEVAA